MKPSQKVQTAQEQKTQLENLVLNNHLNQYQEIKATTQRHQRGQSFNFNQTIGTSIKMQEMNNPSKVNLNQTQVSNTMEKSQDQISYYSPNAKFKHIRVGKRTSLNDDLHNVNINLRTSFKSESKHNGSQFGATAQSFLNDQSHQTKIFQHYNPVGPADYKLPDLFGKTSQKFQIVESNIKNKPSYSFGQKHSVHQIISNQHKQELLGQDSPGVGFYKEQVKVDLKDKSKILQETTDLPQNGQSTDRDSERKDQSNKEKSIFGKSERFFIFQEQKQLQEQVPIQYNEDQNSSLLQKSFQNEKVHQYSPVKEPYETSFRQTQIFKEAMKNQNLGPGTYDINTKYSDFNMTFIINLFKQFYRDLTSRTTFRHNQSLSKTKADKLKQNEDLNNVNKDQNTSPIKQQIQVKDRFAHTGKVFFKEWRLDHTNKTSLGPGVYEHQKFRLKKPLNYAFAKKDRGLLTQSKDNSPSPATYNSVDMNWTQQDQFQAQFGIQPVNMNASQRMNSQNFRTISDKNETINRNTLRGAALSMTREGNQQFQEQVRGQESARKYEQKLLGNKIKGGSISNAERKMDITLLNSQHRKLHEKGLMVQRTCYARGINLIYKNVKYNYQKEVKLVNLLYINFFPIQNSPYNY